MPENETTQETQYIGVLTIVFTGRGVYKSWGTQRSMTRMLLTNAFAFPFTCVSCVFARHSYTTVRSCYNQCTREASARVTGYDVRPRIGTTVELTAYSKCFRNTKIAQNIFSHILNPAYRIQGCLGKHSTHLSISGRPCRRQHTFLDLVLRKHWRSGVCSPETVQLKSPI